MSDGGDGVSCSHASKESSLDSKIGPALSVPDIADESAFVNMTVGFVATSDGGGNVLCSFALE
jgi:hypothetical protein